jgi:hypothetical protein
MDDAALDQRFGWRCLLPLHECRTVRLHGFTPEERDFLTRALHPIETADENDDACLWLIRGESDLETADGRERYDNARIVAVLARRRHAGGWRRCLRRTFPALHEYALFPASNPRVVVPLTSDGNTLTGLGLYRSGRPAGRAATRIAGIASRFHFYSPLRGHVLLIASQDPDSTQRSAASSLISAHVGSHAPSHAVYLGTTLGNRKTIVLPLTQSDPDTIAKIGATEPATASLAREAFVLEELARSGLGSNIPTVRALVPRDSSLALLQEYRKRLRAPKQVFEASVVRFLADLSTLGRHGKPLAPFVHELVASTTLATNGRAADATRSLIQQLEAIADSGAQVHVHHTHGDFTPWNCFWTGKGLFVFDWEESRPDGLALADAFNYMVMPAVLVGARFRTAETLTKAVRFGEDVAMAAGLHGAKTETYFALWLVDRFVRVRHARTEMRHRLARLMEALDANW